MIMTVFVIQPTRAQTHSMDYYGQTPPGDTPELFAPGVVSIDGRYEYGLTVSPDGNDIYFTAEEPGNGLMVINRNNGTWGEPHIANLRKNNSWEFEAFFTVDGSRLYFTSNNDKGQSKFYFVDRTESGWDAAQYLNSPVNNTSVMWCTLSSDHVMYYGNNANFQIHQAKSVDGRFDSIQNLGFRGSHPSIASDGSFFLFNSRNYGGYGQSDILIVYKNADGSWSDPINLGDRINTRFSETCASLSQDGKYIFFSRYNESGGKSNIYWVDAKAILPDPNGPIANQSTGLRFSSIQCAINYANPDDTIVIEPGVYEENITLDQDIAVQSVDPNNPYYIGGTIIQGDPNEPVVTLSNNTANCTLAGLTIRTGAIGIMGTAMDATLHNCRIIDNTIHGIELFEGSSPYFDHCLITANGQIGITMHEKTSSRSTIYCQPTIKDCVIVQNGETAIEGGDPQIVDSIIE